MASLNDNLFTTLVNYTNPRNFGCYLQTQWGAVKVNMSPKGVESVIFDDVTPPVRTDDSVFREAFLNWLKAFQNMTIEEQWQCLSPRGTDFQKKVFRALLKIPFGKQVNYKDIAVEVGKPNASRAVGSAIAANPIALLVPCHRVVPASGGTGNYRWGSDRKLALIEAEQIDESGLYQLFQ